MALFLELSNDVIHCVSDFLTNRDFKSIRLATRQLSALFQLRFDKVFISPSKRNIEVFQAVANHPEYRLQVREVGWDDALFEKCYAIVDYKHWKMGLIDGRTGRPTISERF